MKTLKLGFFLLLSVLAITPAWAADYTLTVNNNTTEDFRLTANPLLMLKDLKAGVQNQKYDLKFMQPVPKFAVLFTSKSTSNKAAVIYKDSQLFCNPQTVVYTCNFSNVTESSATLTLSK